MIGPTVSLVSSNLRSAAYDPDTKDLTIVFVNGGVWVYANVPDEVYQGLIQASSHGGYFHANIRTSYPASRG